MAESATKGVPWYETLKGIAKSTPDPELNGLSKKGPGSKRRVGLAEGRDLHAAAPGSETASQAPSLVSAETRSSTSAQSSVSSFSFPIFVSTGTPPHTSEAPPKSERTVQKSRTAQDGSVQSVPMPPPLPPPSKPAVPEGYAPSTKIALQYAPGVRDFEYHPKPGDRYIFPSESKSKPRPCFSGRSCSIILLVFIVLGIGIALMAILLNPKQPLLDIDTPTLKSLNFTQSSDGDLLNTAMYFPFNLSNPNRYAEVVYSQITSTISYKGSLTLNNFTNPGFIQGKKASTALFADLPDTVTIVPADISLALEGEIANSTVDILLTCSANGKFRMIGIKMKSVLVQKKCQLRVRPEAPGVAAGVLSPPSCD